MKSSEPTLNQAYAMIIQDESQQVVKANVVTYKIDPLVIQAGQGHGFKGKK